MDVAVSVAVAVASDEVSVEAPSASVDVATASLKATTRVEPVSASTRSVCELPVKVWAERVAPAPSMIWTTEMVWTTSVMVEPRRSRTAAPGSSRRSCSWSWLWNSACERMCAWSDLREELCK